MRMNPKKLKVLFLLGVGLLLLIVLISMLINPRRSSNRDRNNNENDASKVDYSEADFGETLDIDSPTTETKRGDLFGTDYGDFGYLSSYYDNANIIEQDGKLYIESSEGYDILSPEWMDEGYASYIEEPEFGSLERFILKDNSVEIRYGNVSMKDVNSYVKDLKEKGFKDIIKDKKSNKDDYYLYTAKSLEHTVSLTYEKGSLYITVY